MENLRKIFEIKIIAIRHQLFKILLLQALFEMFKLDYNSVSTRSSNDEVQVKTNIGLTNF